MGNGEWDVAIRVFSVATKSFASPFYDEGIRGSGDQEIWGKGSPSPIGASAGRGEGELGILPKGSILDSEEIRRVSFFLIRGCGDKGMRRI